MARTTPPPVAEATTSPALEAAIRARERLAEQKLVLEQARDDLATIRAEADARIATAEAERDQLAAERGGRPVTLGAVPGHRRRRTQWSFGGGPQPEDVRRSVDVVAALDEEAAATIGAAIARVDGELQQLADELEQTEARIASLRAELDREQAERAERARLIGERLDWRERAREVLERLGLASG